MEGGTEEKNVFKLKVFSREHKILHPSAFKNKLDKKFTPITFRNYQHLLLLYSCTKMIMMVIIQIYFHDLGGLSPNSSSNTTGQLKFKVLKLYPSLL